MKKMHKIITLVFFTMITGYGYSATEGGFNKPTPKNNDSLVNSKTNIVIFKMITTPPSSTTNSGSLKQAGKVARTSASHPLTYTPPIHWVKPYS